MKQQNLFIIYLFTLKEIMTLIQQRESCFTKPHGFTEMMHFDFDVVKKTGNKNKEE